MNGHPETTNAEQIIRRISELRDLCLHLARIGKAAGLHDRDLDDPLAVGKPAPRWAALRH